MKTVAIMRRSAFYGLILFVLVWTTGSAAAGSGWLEKAKGLLKEVGTKKGTENVVSTEEIVAGLKDMLQVGTETVVGRLGTEDGFNADPSVHIPLPRNLDPVKAALEKVGLGHLTEHLELSLNRAAETATPEAKALFWQSIQEMTLDDAMSIYKGADDAATRYFEGKMSPSLAETMKPLVDNSLAQVGAVKLYDRVMGQYQALPFVPDVKADLSDYVVSKGMEGIFSYLAKEEAAIRQNPAKQTTDLLKRLFGAR